MAQLSAAAIEFEHVDPRTTSPVSAGLQNRLSEVVAVDDATLKARASALTNFDVPDDFADAMRAAGVSFRGNSHSVILDELKARGLTSSSKNLLCYVATTSDGSKITYFLQRYSDSTSNIIGTHRLNFFGDVRTDTLTPGRETATVVSETPQPEIGWLFDDGGQLRTHKSPLKPKTVYEIPLDSLPAEMEDIIWAASQSTKSHGH